MKRETPFCLVSAETPSAPDGETYSPLRAGLREAGLAFSPVYGMWRGVPEHSFLVVLPSGDAGPEIDRVLELAALTKQDSVLYVGADREAALLSRDGSVEPVGHWQVIDYLGERPESYTVGPDGRIYAAVQA